MTLENSTFTSPERQSLDRETRYGHPRRIGSKCDHDLHPSASTHTPWCPACIASLTKAKLDVARKNLVGEGGLSAAQYMRGRRWNQARLKHDIAKQRQERARKEGQLRWEREQVWDEAHQQYDSQHKQATAGFFQSPAGCVVCASMAASYPTNVPEIQITKDTTWWERPGALAVEHSFVSRTLPKPRPRIRKRARISESSKALRQIIQNLGASMYAADTYRKAWESRYKTESAVRRKHSLGEGFHFQPDFWDSPIPGLVSRRNYQHVQENQRMAERRARGNRTRPKPPRSSLSYSETSEEVEVDQDWVETLVQREEREELEREARKVGEEVGYLYFVGGIDGTEEWKEAYLRSDRQLVVRKLVANSETSGSEDDEDEDGDERDYDEMDIDER